MPTLFDVCANGVHDVHGNGRILISQRAATGLDPKEIANYFSARLVMPVDLEKREIAASGGSLLVDSDVTELASTFDVSEQAMTIRLSALGLLVSEPASARRLSPLLTAQVPPEPHHFADQDVREVLACHLNGPGGIPRCAGVVGGEDQDAVRRLDPCDGAAVIIIRQSVEIDHVEMSIPWMATAFNVLVDHDDVTRLESWAPWLLRVARLEGRSGA